MKKGRSVSSWVKAEVLCLLLFSALGVLLIPAQVQAYYIESDVRVMVNYEESNDAYSGAAVASSLSKTIMGPDEGLAQAKASCDLATGSLRAYAYATTGTGYQLSHARAYVKFSDILYFTVPAGFYPEAVSVEATGFMEGSISRHGFTSAMYEFEARFGVGFISFSDNNPNGDVFREFTFTHPLVAAGTNLTEPKEVSVGVKGYLYALSSAGSLQLGETEVDFYNSAGFSSLEVPSGVTWRSDSGVFLSQQIPLPGSLVLLGSGLLGLAGIRRFRKS
jgi:hypothetical protein